MDPLERQVWQRVLGPGGTEPGDVRGLLPAAREQAEAYRRLLQTAPAGERKLLQGLYDGARANLACLQGMAELVGGQSPKAALPRTEAVPPRKLLKQCYDRSRAALLEYTARSADGQFGAVFRAMAEREQQHCARIVQLLGQWGL